MNAPEGRTRSYATLVAVVAALFLVGLAVPFVVGDPLPSTSRSVRADGSPSQSYGSAGDGTGTGPEAVTDSATGPGSGTAAAGTSSAGTTTPGGSASGTAAAPA